MNAISAQRATYAFIDVETTGIDPRNDRVVEVACLIVREGQLLASFDSLVNPQRTIPPTASAIHHITASDVVDAPLLGALAATLQRLCSDAVIVAHNARFDIGFLPFLGARPIICSMRFAMHVVPDAPNFKNQVLRYYLDVNDASLTATTAHRAFGDALVTSRVFARCLDRYLAAHGDDDIDTLIATLAAPHSLRTLRFGRYRAAPIADVPDEYLRWLLGRSALSDDVRFTACAELARRSRRIA